MKARLFPKRAAQYNDVQMHCPLCHKDIIVFEGLHKTIRCYKCGDTFVDRRYKEHTAAFKRLKEELKRRKICG